MLQTRLGLNPEHLVVDVGSGTGISAELFLKNGNTVYAVEPNQKMREQAESSLASYSKFHSVNGVSNSTTLPGAFADFIVAAQAFHWFEPISTRTEFRRILKPNGFVVIIFNDRLTTGSEFLEGYESMLNEFGSDYAQVKHRNVDEKRHHQFLGNYQEFHVPNVQEFDYDGLLGRWRSSSYAPKEGHPTYPEVMRRLRELFDRTQKNGRVRMEYDTQVFYSDLKLR